MMLRGKDWSFIHIPKCGGTAVRSVLTGRESAVRMPMYPQHPAAHQFHWISRLRPAGCVFTFVRHPATWLRSYWMHRMAHGWLPNRYLDRLGSIHFAEFVRRVCYHEPGYVSKMFEAHTSAYEDITVARLEDDITETLFQCTGLKLVIPKINEGVNPPAISLKLLGVIAKSEAAALTRYNYSDRIDQ